ncbi:MAG: response regulator transcription factor [Syntrophales bacterium]|nr:response regulator transcription factor [Syntrophales bacterium]
MNKYKVLIVDDHEIVREGLKSLLGLEDNIESVGEASSCMECLTLMENQKFDVVLMDIKMPGVDGIESTRLVKEKYPKTKVILLTNYDDEAFVLGGLKVGADAYVLKDVRTGDLVNIVNNVLMNKFYVDPGIAGKIIERLSDSVFAKASLPPTRPHFSQRELQMLEYLVKGMSNKEMANKAHLSIDTIKAHIRNIYKKMDVTSRAKAVRKAIEDGVICLPR